MKSFIVLVVYENGERVEAGISAKTPNSALAKALRTAYGVVTGLSIAWRSDG